MVSKTLYVGNLPWSAAEEELLEFFGSATQLISVKIIRDRETGRSRGFGFIDVPDEDAEKIVEEFNQKEFKGRKLVVSPARPKPQRGRHQFKR